MRKIELVVNGVDLDNDDTDELIAVHLSEYGWFSRDGIVTATVYLEDGADAVHAACDAAHRIEHHLGARVPRVYEDLVGVSDIAARTGLHREGVRLLTLGKRGPGDFPAHRGTVGSGSKSSRVWQWGDVVPWLQQHVHLCLDEQPISTRETTQINAHLERVTHDFDDAWQRCSSAPRLHSNITWQTRTAVVVAAGPGIGQMYGSARVTERLRPVPTGAGFVALTPT